ncbi:SIS domain-containing protein [Marinivivus vitaminiproducens]|uniref:SIS domain-containing protein n=1 Tax=Marinivivus vitaminiproducens TaxID=3035935 RepID=UPI0027A4A8AD|nr:SIS domain-containing protein [Geminicoccaceae bacterium SCSIO 64248]
MSSALSLMRQEIDETPDALRRLFGRSGDAIRDAGLRLRALDPKVIVTVARGSSDHAASYFKYAAEIRSGRPVASLGPSIASVYGAPLRLAGSAAIAISQSGRSPDIVALLEAARAGGGETIAIVNAEESPLAAAADHVIPLAAGPERSVAATKSCIASVVAALGVLAAWTEDRALTAALEALPAALERAVRQDWTPALAACAGGRSLYTLGRGPGLAVAAEAALKFKETSNLHAEAFSGAEVLHGPVALVEDGFPVLAFAPQDAAASSLSPIARRLADAGAALFVVGEADAGIRLPHVGTSHPLTEPLSMLASFYGFVEALARARGHDPDTPRGLRKVTETL